MQMYWTELNRNLLVGSRIKIYLAIYTRDWLISLHPHEGNDLWSAGSMYLLQTYSSVLSRVTAKFLKDFFFQPKKKSQFSSETLKEPFDARTITQPCSLHTRGWLCGLEHFGWTIPLTTEQLDLRALKHNATMVPLLFETHNPSYRCCLHLKSRTSERGARLQAMDKHTAKYPCIKRLTPAF